MLKLTGVLKKEEINEFVRKDGTPGKSRILYIETPDSVYPYKVTCNDLDRKIGKQGETVSVDVDIFAYYFQDKQRKRANVDIYIPSKK